MKLKKSFFNNIINIVYFLMMLTIFLICLFLSNIRNYYIKANLIINNYIALFIGIIIIFVLLLLIKKSNYKKRNKRLYIFTFIFTLILFYLGCSYVFVSKWDPEILIENASVIATKNYNAINNIYYSWFPNNVLLTVLFSFIIKITNYIGINKYFGLIFYQSLLFSLTGLFLFKSLDLLLGEKKYKYTKIGYFIYIIFIGFSPYLVVPYSDTIGLFIISIILFLYLKIVNGDKKNMYYMLIGFLSILGFFIKPQILIISISISIIYFVFNFKLNKDILKKIVIILIGILCAIILNFFAKKYSHIKFNPSQKIGVIHFLMMGLNDETDGTYYSKDYEYTLSFSNPKDRTKANIKVIKKRIKNYGIIGLMKFYVDKTLGNYDNGTFCWLCESGDTKSIMETNNILGNLSKSIYYIDGDRYYLFTGFCQSMWMIILFLNIFSIFKNKNKAINMIMLSIVGITIFELLFEGRSRYLFSYSSLYIILSIIGLINMISYFKSKRIGVYENVKE